MDKYDNIIGVDRLDRPIYRIFSPKYFRNLLNDNRLTLVHPEMWDDPFENILTQSQFRRRDGKLFTLHPMRDRLYGQCWTFNEESDALWRVYSPAQSAIKVRATVRKLFDAFWKTKNKFASLSYFMGAVKYYTEDEFVSFLTRPDGMQKLIFGGIPKGYAESLLVKRDAFSYEEEVRLIYCRAGERMKPAQFHKVRIEPNDLFAEAVLDPRLTGKEAARLEKDLRAWGFTQPIRKSKLYQSRTFVIKLKVSDLPWMTPYHPLPSD